MSLHPSNELYLPNKSFKQELNIVFTFASQKWNTANGMLIKSHSFAAYCFFICLVCGDLFINLTSFSELAGFIAFSTYPDLSRKITAFFALAPVATITHSTSSLLIFTQLPQPLIGVSNFSF